MVETACWLELEEADLPERHLAGPAEEALVVAQVLGMTASADERLVTLPPARSILDGLEVVVHSHILVETLGMGSLLDTLYADWAQRVSRSLMVTAQQTDRNRSQP